jgi:hypothetical protein
VRRWISDVQGPARVNVTVHNTDTCGDGVTGALLVDGATAWSQAFPVNGPGVDDLPVAGVLEIGTFVELHIGSGPNDSCDTTETAMTITSR